MNSYYKIFRIMCHRMPSVMKSALFEVYFTNLSKNVSMWGREMVQQLRAHTALTEDPKSVPSTYGQWLTHTCNSSFSGI